MSKSKAVSVLQELATSDEARSETAKLRDIIDEVEVALAAGVLRTKVLEALHKQGFSMTLRAFDSALYRIRKQKAADSSGQDKATMESKPSSTASKETPTPETTGEGNSSESSKKITNPADVRKAMKRDIDLDDYTE